MDFIQNTQELQELIQSNKPFFIYKHSTTCPISAKAKREFEEFLSETDADYVAVKVIEDRDISSEIETFTGVQHESPQAILMKGEDVLWHDSHRALTQQTFSEQWNKAK